MIRLSLTTFIDIARATGTAKVTTIGRIKARDDYHPSRDYWKPLRNAIKRAHQQRDQSVLNRVAQEVTGASKQDNYRKRVETYKRWWGRTDYQWFNPPVKEWRHEDVVVRVNPELGLATPKSRTALKLWFKHNNGSPLRKLEMDIVLHILQLTVTPDHQYGAVGIIDVPRSNLLAPTVEKRHLETALIGEASFISAIWDRL